MAAALSTVFLAAAPLERAAPAPRAGGHRPGAPVPASRHPVAEDPLDLLWNHRLDFAAGGAPLVTIRLMEGQQEIAFHTTAPARLRARGGGEVRIPPGQTFRVRGRGALPAAIARYPLLGDALYADRARLDATRRLWEGRGIVVRQRMTGGVYGIAGHVIDNRRIVLLAAGDGSAASAHAFAEEALARYGGRTGTYSEIVTRPSGRLEVLDAAGVQVAEGDALVSLDVGGRGSFTVHRVEHDVGQAAHGFEDRTYHGRLLVTIDSSGHLAVVLAVTLEELLRGLVPSELPAGSPREALKAQAVTARSNVLAQIGTRHLTDPYVLCSEVHCQAYRGEAAQAPATDAAVRATAGEALFGREDHALVDAVYSAMCGGHGEDNDAVWPTMPSAGLRGRPDLPPDQARAWQGGLASEARLRSFLAGAPTGWCGRASGVREDRYRWTRRFSPSDLSALAATLGVGRVRGLEVTARGSSGRARALVVTGDAGQGVVEGELRIRRLLGDLPSAMFVVDRAADDLVLHGGGWGHGVGMCQWGAIGRAEAGQGYREILRAYYSGAEVAKIY